MATTPGEAGILGFKMAAFPGEAGIVDVQMATEPGAPHILGFKMATIPGEAGILDSKTATAPGEAAIFGVKTRPVSRTGGVAILRTRPVRWRVAGEPLKMSARLALFGRAYAFAIAKLGGKEDLAPGRFAVRARGDPSKNGGDQLRARVGNDAGPRMKPCIVVLSAVKDEGDVFRNAKAALVAEAQKAERGVGRIRDDRRWRRETKEFSQGALQVCRRIVPVGQMKPRRLNIRSPHLFMKRDENAPGFGRVAE